MGLESVVQVTITRATQGVTQAGFGVPLILGPNAVFSGIRQYATLEAVGDDFDSSDGEYLAAAAEFAQTPRPEKVKIMKTSAVIAQVDTITPTAVNSTIYTVTVNGIAFSYTSDASATVSEIVAGLIAAINAGTEPVTASGSTTLILTADAAGEGFTVELNGNMSIVHTTANVGIASDILNAKQLDPDDWYALITVDKTDLTIKEAAKTIESLRRIYNIRNEEASIKTASTTDLFSFLKNKNYFRTAPFWHSVPNDYADAAHQGRFLPTNPGSETWVYKTLAGVTTDVFTDSERANLESKNASYYERIAGVTVVRGGKTSAGEYIDIIRGIDWLQARIEEGVFQLLITVDKVPFTDAGIAMIENVLREKLENAKTQGLLASYTITVPKASSISAQDKAARRLTGMSFQAVAQGAVHTVVIQGVVTL